MTRASLTAKLCWLLAICGFLRSSDIGRISDDQTHTDPQGRLVLHIIAPKEKRKGQAALGSGWR